MALRPLSRAELRELDRRAIEEFGIPGVVLMENAGREAARWLVELGIDGPVLICCGKGNNGGDGYVMARYLEAWGRTVHVALMCDPAELKGDASVNFQILRSSGTPVTIWDVARDDRRIAELFKNADWVVDGLLGTGATGEIRGPLRPAIETIDSCGARKLAIDIPSGLDCDTGRPLGCVVRASHTATFVATKFGFATRDAAEYTGEVRVFDIGLPARLLDEFRI
jgi:NAD(P)H-hydrate epimerase